MLTPVLALVVWTLIIWIVMYATRLPAMRAAKIKPQSALHPGSLSTLPVGARVVADNYNHLHEQPTIFYALCFYSHLAGAADSLAIALAWAYVASRVGHSFAQIVLRHVMARFALFSIGSIILAIIAIRNVIALMV